MDLFRKSKKKQSGLVQSLTDQLDQMAIQESSEHAEEEEEHNNGSSAMICHPNLSLVMDDGEDTSSAIDALVNSDDEGDVAEIFNDSDDDDASPPSVQDHHHHTPSSVRSTLSKGATKAFQDVLASLDGGGGGLDDEDDDDDDEEDDDNDKSHNSDSAEDYTDDEDEGEEGYKPGGYHPVKVGEVYNQRCVIACVRACFLWFRRLSVGCFAWLFFFDLSKLLTHS